MCYYTGMKPMSHLYTPITLDSFLRAMEGYMALDSSWN